MVNTTEIQSVDEKSIVPIAEAAIAVAKDDLAYAYRKAMWSLYNFFPNGELLLTDFNETTLRDWVAGMLCNDVTIPTAKYYFETVAALYNKAVKAGLAEKTTAFRTVKSLLAGYTTGEIPVLDEKSFDLLGKLINGVIEIKPELRLYTDIFLFSFYTRGMGVADILALTADSLPDLPEAARTIASRYADPRRKKLFPRSKAEEVERKTLMVIHHLGFNIPHDTTVAAVAGGLWINAALRLGIPSSTVRGCTCKDLAATYAVIGFANCEEVGKGRVAEISEMVVQSIADNPRRWHVMKLRPHVSFDMLLERIKNLKDEKVLRTENDIETFYPLEEIRVKTGRKVTTEQRPVLRDVVFFRCTDSTMSPFFRGIGDLAWCYRNTRQGSYAIVSQTEMDHFQRTIAIFTPDFDVAPLGTTKIEAGEKVLIIGGPFAGYEGIVDNNNLVTFSLRIMGDNGLEWTVNIDPRLLKIQN
jgi:transcription antitermination factor NusG